MNELAKSAKNKINEQGFGLIGILAVIIVVIVAVGGGAYVWHKDHKTKSNIVTTSQSKTSSQSKSSSSTTTNPYAEWKSYTSSTEKLSFKYPSTWKAVSSPSSVGTTGADSLQLTSPSGAVVVSWFSVLNGNGGACDSSLSPSESATSGSPGPCPYWYVLDKQKLAGTNLYFVDGVTTSNGTAYSPWCGLQSSSGILTSESNIGYMTFLGKNNEINGQLQQAGLMCSKVPGNLGGIESMTGTKAQASAYLSSAEFQQAKLILLSASY